MRTDIARWLTGILGAWLVSAGLMFSPPAAAACAPESATRGWHHAVEFAPSAPSPDVLGGGDHESVLNEQYRQEIDAPRLFRVEGVQPFAPPGDAPYQRAALPARVCYVDSIALVEPRFLRYSRLLN